MHLAGKLCDVLHVEGRMKELIQIAGFYHDIGHGPYSHLYNKVLRLLNPKIYKPIMKIDLVFYFYKLLHD